MDGCLRVQMKHPILKVRDRFVVLTKSLGWVPPFLFRIILGLLCLESGWFSLQSPVFEGLDASAYALSYAQIACGLFLVLGLATRLVSLPLMVAQVIVLITLKNEQISSFFDLLGHAEFIYFLLLLDLFLRGAGSFSLDFLFNKYLDQPYYPPSRSKSR